MKLRTPLKQGISWLAAAAKRHYTFPRVGQLALRFAVRRSPQHF